jgi:hypothetical protein
MSYPTQETLVQRCLTVLPAFDAAMPPWVGLGSSIVLLPSAIVSCDVFWPGLAALYLMTAGWLSLGRAVGGAAEC